MPNKPSKRPYNTEEPSPGERKSKSGDHQNPKPAKKQKRDPSQNKEEKIVEQKKSKPRKKKKKQNRTAETLVDSNVAKTTPKKKQKKKNEHSSGKEEVSKETTLPKKIINSNSEENGSFFAGDEEMDQSDEEVLDFTGMSVPPLGIENDKPDEVSLMKEKAQSNQVESNEAKEKSGKRKESPNQLKQTKQSKESEESDEDNEMELSKENERKQNELNERMAAVEELERLLQEKQRTIEQADREIQEKMDSMNKKLEILEKLRKKKFDIFKLGKLIEISDGFNDTGVFYDFLHRTVENENRISSIAHELHAVNRKVSLLTRYFSAKDRQLVISIAETDDEQMLQEEQSLIDQQDLLTEETHQSNDEDYSIQSGDDKDITYQDKTRYIDSEDEIDTKRSRDEQQQKQSDSEQDSDQNNQQLPDNQQYKSPQQPSDSEQDHHKQLSEDSDTQQNMDTQNQKQLQSESDGEASTDQDNSNTENTTEPLDDQSIDGNKKPIDLVSDEETLTPTKHKKNSQTSKANNYTPMDIQDDDTIQGRETHESNQEDQKQKEKKSQSNDSKKMEETNNGSTKVQRQTARKRSQVPVKIANVITPVSLPKKPSSKEKSKTRKKKTPLPSFHELNDVALCENVVNLFNEANWTASALLNKRNPLLIRDSCKRFFDLILGDESCPDKPTKSWLIETIIENRNVVQKHHLVARVKTV